MSKPRLVFMGTPDFAVPCLQALITAGYPIALVVTQPDKPVGRKQILTPPPVKQVAQAAGLEVYQPAKVRQDPDVLSRLRAAEAELFVVVAYGKILPQEILDLPTRGCLNVHASLLPKYRGSAPIQWSLVNGESETGVTTMLMDAGMDTGDMLLKRSLRIDPDESAQSLSDRLSALGAEALLETIPAYLKGELQPQPQDHAAATVIPMLHKEDGEIHWGKSARAIYNQLRGLNPWPGSYTFWRDRSLKIKAARPYTGESDYQGNPGQVLDIRGESLLVRTGDGILELLEVHPADGKAMSAGAFARGQRVQSGDFLGLAPAC